MSYRPQFAMSRAPEGFTYQEFIYSFDGSNIPALASLSLAPGDELIHIPLKLDNDADFIWLGTKIDGTALGVKFETPWTEPLTDGYCPAPLLAGRHDPYGGGWNPRCFCPAGSVISLSLKKPFVTPFYASTHLLRFLGPLQRHNE